MADGLHRDRSRDMAVGVRLDSSQDKVRVGVLPDSSRVKVQAGVRLDSNRDKVRAGGLLDNSRVKVRVDVLLDNSRVKVRVGVLTDSSRVKVQAGVLPDSSRLMAAAVALRANRAVADALQDHHPVKEAVAMAGATAAVDKVAGTTSSRVAVSLNVSPNVAGNGRNIATFASLLPMSPVSKNHFTDQASASASA